MRILEQAYRELYPDGTASHFILKYSGRFKGYNGNIKMRWGEITVNLSKQWKGVSPDIQKGLIQELLTRLFKTKKQTINMELYHNFIKSLPNVAPKTHTHPVLEQSFNRVNNRFFNGMMPQPNLKIGNGINRLGTYEYATDTITISKILMENEELMDYVMYHEMLHKKHQYKAKPGRQLHHSAAFKRDEARFPDAERLEIELNKIVRQNKRRLSWLW
ncbi:MAG: hypothetical protein QW165_04430 [Candidatus Woesearchaeota archaeon]